MKKNKNSKTIFWSSIIGNSLDHYDSALYMFLAPFMAPIFFPKSDPVVALILFYGLKSLGIFARPFGAIIFGHLALRHSVKKLLIITLTGVAISTFLIGIIPGYNKIGIAAPILLMVVRTIQGFFASGEHNIAALFILDHVGKDNYGKASSYYLCSTMAGSLLASLAAVIVSQSSDPSQAWRIAFLVGIITGGFALILRLTTTFPDDNHCIKNEELKKSINILKQNKWKLLKIIFISSLTFVTYSVPFIFFNSFIPLFGKLKTEDLLIHNTILLVIDILMIPIAGYLADKFNVAKWMAGMAFIIAITIVPIFYLLPYLDILGVTAARIWIIILGVGFVAPLNSLLFQMKRGKEKYLLTGFGYAIGTELLGRNSTAVCLGLWYFTENTVIPGLYLCLIASCATIAVFSEIKNLSVYPKNEKL
jgi:MFS family permease